MARRPHREAGGPRTADPRMRRAREGERGDRPRARPRRGAPRSSLVEPRRPATFSVVHSRDGAPMLVSAFLVQIGWAPCGADAYVFGNGALRPSPRLHPALPCSRTFFSQHCKLVMGFDFPRPLLLEIAPMMGFLASPWTIRQSGTFATSCASRARKSATVGHEGRCGAPAARAHGRSKACQGHTDTDG